MRTKFVIAVAVLAASLAAPSSAGAADATNRILSMSVALTGRQVGPDQIVYCRYGTAITFTHSGQVHIDVLAKDASGTSVAGANGFFRGSGQETYRDELWLAEGQEIDHFESVLIRQSATPQQAQSPGPGYRVLDTYAAGGATASCPA